MKHEQTLIIVKPDALNRGIIGEIISRFERKGLKMVGLKMAKLTSEILREHYSHLVDKPFYPRIEEFMKGWPVILIVLEGLEVVDSVRLITGDTMGRKADAGTIRGDLSMSVQTNIVHASDSVENAKKEVARFFTPEELYQWERLNFELIYAEDER